MFVTAEEFQNNFNKYLKLVEQEDIIITREGETVATVSGAKNSPSTIDDLRNDYIKTFGKPPDELGERLLQNLYSGDTEQDPLKAITGILKGLVPDNIDKKQIREMRLAERYDADNA